MQNVTQFIYLSISIFNIELIFSFAYFLPFFKSHLNKYIFRIFVASSKPLLDQNSA